MTVVTADINAALLKYYDTQSHRIFFEVSNDTGARARRRIDAVALGIWPSTGYEIIGIEVKVSRGDFKEEMKKPEKAQALMRFCSRWFLACPAKLVKPDELPRTWGLLELKKGQLKQTVPAPLLDPEPITPGFMMAVLRNANSVDAQLVNRLVEERVAESDRRFEESVAVEVRRQTRDLSSKYKRALEIWDRLTEMTGADPESWKFDQRALAAAYLFVRESGTHHENGYGNLNRIISDLGRAKRSLRVMKTSLETLSTSESGEAK